MQIWSIKDAMFFWMSQGVYRMAQIALDIADTAVNPCNGVLARGRLPPVKERFVVE
jgi:hypothetical protein